MEKAAAIFESIVSQRGRLKGKDRSERRLLFLVSTTIMLLWGPFFLLSKERPPLLLGFNVLLTAPCISVCVACVCGVTIRKHLMRVFVACMFAAALAGDLQQRTSIYPSLWPILILVLDGALLLRLGNSFATCLMSVACVWLAVVTLESIVRFGLYDLPGTSPQGYRWVRVKRVYACDKAPCGVSAYTGGLEAAIGVFILLVHCVATRGFADAVEKEQAAMARTIQAVETIAQLLAGYDVDTVAEILDETEGQLPAAMREALGRLEQNLRAYRPYLPAILLEQHQASCEASPCMPVVVAPGSVTQEAALVFTDIRASTSIWEAAPEAMKRGMRIHNGVVRAVMAAYGGYEVKTIGDAFMVAFGCGRAGVDFGLAVQEALLDAEWPAALLEVPLCRRVDHWGGLTVRIGVNEGAVSAETNALTGRVDYFGHTVNVAARLEGRCVPGAVAVPATLWERVRHECAPTAAGERILVELNGVHDPLPIYNVWPKSLADRQQKPLCDKSVLAHPDSMSTLGSAQGLSIQGHRLRTARQSTATVCTVGLGLDDALSSQINDSLAVLVPLLEQSNGVLVTLLGQLLFVGWNLARPMPAHAEGALRFAQRLLRGHSLGSATLGVASGAVEHGDVGTASQRFLTATGPAVELSRVVWRIAADIGCRCLYVGDGIGTNTALRDLLVAMDDVCTPGNAQVYQLVEICPSVLSPRSRQGSPVYATDVEAQESLLW